MTTIEISSYIPSFPWLVFIVSILVIYIIGLLMLLMSGKKSLLAVIVMTLLVISAIGGVIIYNKGKDGFNMSPEIMSELMQDKYGVTSSTGGGPDVKGIPLGTEVDYNPSDPMHNSWHASSLTIDGKTYENCDFSVSNPRERNGVKLVDAELKCSKVSDGERIVIQPK